VLRHGLELATAAAEAVELCCLYSTCTAATLILSSGFDFR
jgi:hypothetical protein